MKNFFAGMTLLATLIGASSTRGAPVVGASPPPLTAVATTGTWKVTKVSIGPEQQVSALVDNDPQYQGAVIRINGGAITWDAKATNKKGTYDNCHQPTFTPSTEKPGFTAIQCDGKPWGFGVTIKAISQRTMTLNWYDGGILTLTRQ